MILEATGQHHYLGRHVVNARPESSRTYMAKLCVSVLGKDDVQSVNDIVKSVKVDNDTIEWDCQDHVLEVLDALEDEFILESDDEEYVEARKELKMKRGAIL